ncbi:MAG: phosphatidate cytidylyltransferase [Bacteroidetes bacterium]|nr:phosphatidate cytidylyltransferase [Bacteroidota bacterium]
MSNVRTRIMFAVVAIPGVLLLAWLGGYAWALFVAAVLTASLIEFAAMARAKGVAPQTATMIAAGLALLLVFLHERLGADIPALLGQGIVWPLQWQAFLWILMLFMAASLLIELFRNRPSPLLNVAVTVLGTVYIGLFLGSAVGIREIFTVHEFHVGPVFGTADLDARQFAQLDRWGGYTVMAMLATIWICDTAAYFGGKAMGRHKLFLRVSPNKTWEGAIWGFTAALAAMTVAHLLLLDYLSLPQALIIGVIVGTVGQLGDLVESLLKRDAGVKDSSSLLPGHGGVFDRFDSFIFVSPAVFLYLDFIVFA